MDEEPKSNKAKKKLLPLVWWQLLLFLIVAGLATYTSSDLDSTFGKYIIESEPIPSATNKKPSGYSGFFELNKQVGLPCDLWGLPYRKLKQKSGTLMIVAPVYPLQDFEISQILQWIKSGNNLVLLDNNLDSRYEMLFKAIKVTGRLGKKRVNHICQVSTVNKESSHVNNLVISTDTYLDMSDPDKSASKILANIGSDTVMLAVDYGRGQCIIGTDPGLCANRQLSEKKYWSNFQFMINCLRTLNSEILFDQKCHGLTSSDSLFMSVARSPVGLILIQLCLIFIIALVSTSQRFGQIKQLTFSRVSSSLEYIDGLSSTYLRAKASPVVLNIIANSFKTRLCKALNIAPDESIEKIAEAWQQSLSNKDANTLRDFLYSTNDATSLSDEELLKLIKQCNELNDQAKTLMKVG